MISALSFVMSSVRIPAVIATWTRATKWAQRNINQLCPLLQLTEACRTETPLAAGIGRNREEEVVERNVSAMKTFRMPAHLDIQYASDGAWNEQEVYVRIPRLVFLQGRAAFRRDGYNLCPPALSKTDR